jgi:hypothetical protein
MKTPTQQKLFAAPPDSSRRRRQSVRAFKSVGGTPLFVTRGSGATIEDVDGNRFIDYVMSWGPLIHGHAPRGLVKAIARRRARHQLRRAEPARAPARRTGANARAIDGARQVRQLGNRGDDERGAPRARVQRARLGSSSSKGAITGTPTRFSSKQDPAPPRWAFRPDPVFQPPSPPTHCSRATTTSLGPRRFVTRWAERSRRSSSSRSPATWAWYPPLTDFCPGCAISARARASC